MTTKRGVDVAVDALAVYRLTRLLQQDSVPPMPRVRAWLLARYGARPMGALVDCPWCLGVWIAFLAPLGDRVCPRLWGVVSRALAASAVTGLLSQVAAEMDRSQHSD